MHSIAHMEVLDIGEELQRIAHMEVIDIVDEYGNPTGQSEDRRIVHARGLRHRTTHIWVTREHRGRWQVLLQKRAQGKDSCPGCYDTSAAGHIPVGQDPLASAYRELEEELGICAEEGQLSFAGIRSVWFESEFYGEPWKDNEVIFVYAYTGQVDESKLRLQEEEVEGVKWFDLDIVRERLVRKDADFCVPIEVLDLVRDWLDERDRQ